MVRGLNARIFEIGTYASESALDFPYCASYMNFECACAQSRQRPDYLWNL